VDESHKQLLLLVRGTSSWADCLTDIVAHTEQLGTGGLLLPSSSHWFLCQPVGEAAAPLCVRDKNKQQGRGNYQVHAIITVFGP
jgi:hypothetical protein